MSLDESGRRRPGPAPRLSRESIADAVLELGFEGLTVTAVGARLGSSHAALYRHVRDRDDLVRAAAERLAERHPPAPPAADWSQALTDSAVTFWTLLRSTPGLVDTLASVPGGREPLGRYVRALTRELLDHGFTPDLAVLAADSVLDLARDSARTTTLLADPEHVRRIVETRWPEPGDAPIREVVIDAVDGDPQDWFRRKLDVVVRGIASLLDAAAAHPRRQDQARPERAAQ